MTRGPVVRSRLDRTVEHLRPQLVRASDVLGQSTRRLRALPDLLIMGGQRCGTTSMYKALVQQPTIFRPVWRKGVHYFDVSYDRDVDWYRGHFPLHAQLVRSSHRNQTRALCFESSPYYLFHPLAADRIAATLPDVKVLVLVRDPVERAYSAHAHELARGFEHLAFEQALEAEPARLAGEEDRLRSEPGYESKAHRHQAYRQRGEYAPQLARLAELFGRERVKVVDSHRFFETPQEVYSDVLGWLEVDQTKPAGFDRYNGRPRLSMPEHLRRELEEHFAPYDEQLVPWLGHRPTWRA
jgi:hypothetical protein